MVWFHVDDAIAFHPKAIQAGNAALGLWVRAGAWATATGTDGFVPVQMARKLGRKREADGLVSGGLWAEVRHENGRLSGRLSGYFFHDWDHYQLSKEVLETRRSLDRQRKRDQRKRENVTGGVTAESRSVTPFGVTRDPHAQAFPTHPFPLVVTGGNQSPVGSDPPPEPASAGPPNKFCDKHMPNGTTDNCGPCMAARKRNDEYWLKQTLDKRKAEQQRRRDETNTRLDAIPNCRLCDDDGYRHPEHSTVCDHIDRTKTAANGIAKVRAAIRGQPEDIF